MSGDFEKRVVAFMEAIEELKFTEPELLTALRRAVDYEARHGPGWTFIDLPARPDHIRRLVQRGLVKEIERGKFALADRDAVLEAMVRAQVIPRPRRGPAFDIDMNAFNGVVGYAAVKKAILMALRARAPVHVLLVGPPGYGKSLFVDSVVDYLERTNQCVGRVEGGKGLTTSVGIIEAVLQFPPDTPCLLAIDELDKLDKREMDALYRLMETGEVVVTKHRTLIREKRRVWVLAACNRLDPIPAPILSRFMVVRIKPLSEEGYKRVVAGILVKREGVDPELARYIAEKLAPITRDPRDAIRVARMAWSKEDVDWIVDTLMRKSHAAEEA